MAVRRSPLARTNAGDAGLDRCHRPAAIMSFTRELGRKESPVRRFLEETFPHTRGTLGACGEALRAPLVADLPPGSPPDAYRLIGTAMGYRIRYHFAVTPWNQLAAAPGALLVIRPEEAPASIAARGIRPIDARWRLARSCVAEFFEGVERTVSLIAPHHRRPGEEEEHILARFCLVLAAFEWAFRSRAWPPRHLGDRPPERAAELLALVPDDWVLDVAALGAAFSDRYPKWHGRADAILNPAFAGSIDVGGADADLIADGCLWEIKTTRARSARRAWLLLLDYGADHAIERVGLLLPRQGTRVSWPVGDLIAELSGRDDLGLPVLRQRFRRVCEPLRAGGAGRGTT